MVREHRLRLGRRSVTLLEGPAGWGEVSPLDGYPCDPAPAWRAAWEAALTGWPTPRRDEIPVNALVDRAGFDPATLALYPAVKVKVGFDGDLELVAAVRDVVGPHAALRVDANGAWDVDAAVARLDRLARYDLELAEQPVRTLAELAQLRRRTTVPLAADECVRTLDDARRLRQLDAVDALVLKVQPCGGVRAALDLADVAGVPAIPTSMHETSVGVAAGVALAAALPDLSFACGLATVTTLPVDVTTDPLVPTGGVLHRRTVEPDPVLLARYSVRPSVVAQEARS